MQVDGIDVSADEVISRPPGTTAVFKLVGPDVPNGEVVTAYTKGLADITEGPNQFQLTFTNGETDTVTIYAPGQGIRVNLGVDGKRVRHQQFTFRGFGS